RPHSRMAPPPAPSAAYRPSADSARRRTAPTGLRNESLCGAAEQTGRVGGVTRATTAGSADVGGVPAEGGVAARNRQAPTARGIPPVRQPPTGRAKRLRGPRPTRPPA